MKLNMKYSNSVCFWDFKAAVWKVQWNRPARLPTVDDHITNLLPKQQGDVDKTKDNQKNAVLSYPTNCDFGLNLGLDHTQMCYVLKW